jgi:hypothetical protein
LALSLRRIPISDIRIIYFRVLDSENNSQIPGAKAFVQRIGKDSNNKDIAIGAASVYCGSNCVSDANGLLEARGLSVADEGKLVVSIMKDGYIFKTLKPTLFKVTEGPQNVLLTKATSLNSGSAKIRVKSYPDGRKLAGARAFLYLDSTDLGISRISLNESGVFTDSNGEAFYFGLPGYPNGRYSASAAFSGLSSSISPTQDIDAGQTGIFDLNINLSASFIELELIDYTGTEISNLSRAVVNLFYSDAEFASTSTSPAEQLAYDPANRVFVSNGYEAGRNFLVSVSLENYAPNFLEIRGLGAGRNHFKLIIYPTSVLDKNVNIFFNGLYKNDSELMLGNKASFISLDNVLDGSLKGYYAKADVVINADMNYSDLFSMIRNNNTVSTLGLPYKTGAFFKERGTYVCAPPSKSPINDDNFYIQTNPNCVKINDSVLGVQAAAHWQESLGKLRKGTYYLVSKLVFAPQAKAGDTLHLTYSAKEKHGANASEDSGEIYFKIGTAICPPTDPACSKIYFKVSLNNSPTDSESFAYNASAKRFTKNTQFKLTPEASNSIKVSIYNNSQQALSGVKLTAYSFAGNSNLESFAFESSGNLHFDSIAGSLSKEISSQLSIDPLSYSGELTAAIFPEKINSTNYLVLVAEARGEKYLIFFDTKTPARTLVLSGAKFLSGVMDQNFDGEVYAYTGNAPMNIESVSLKVKLNCSGNNIVANAVSNLEKSGNYFKAKINGIYAYGKDCIEVDITPTDPTYYNLHKVIYAGSGGTLDPSLACIDASFPNAVNDLSKITLNWNQATVLALTNRCNGPVAVKVETGLVCDNCSATIDTGRTVNFTITGRNSNYDASAPTPNFTDLLGFFPVYVKAKYSSSSKKYAVASKLDVHLKNDNECFAITKDAFNFLTETSPVNFALNNSCQYTAFGDYFVPKAYLTAVGADLNNPLPKYDYIDFNYGLSVTGGSYTTTYSERPATAYLRYAIDPKTLQKIPDQNFNHYIGIKLNLRDFGGTTEKLFFKWVDLNTPLGYYGAKIDGNILVTYRNGSKQLIEPKVNFALGKNPSCSCNGVPAIGANACAGQPEPSKQYCELNKEASPGFEDETDTNFYGGIAYNLFPAGNVASIDFNAMGNKDLTNLNFSAILIVNYNENIPVTTINRTQQTKQFNLGAFRIYPVEGMTFILKNLSYGKDIGRSMKEAFCKKKLEGAAWNEGNLIYWALPSFANYNISKEVCIKDSNFLFGVSGHLLNALPSSSLLGQMQLGLNWIGTEGNYGLWTSIPGAFDTAAEAIVLARTSTGFVQRTALISNIDKYSPFCAVDVSGVRSSDGRMGLNLLQNECESMPLRCSNTIPKICELADLHKLNAFFDEEYLSVQNPIVEITSSNARSNNAQLGNSAVVVWISGNFLKARFLGENYLGYDDGSIDLSLVDTDASGVQYAIINVKDYVNMGRTRRT